MKTTRKLTCVVIVLLTLGTLLSTAFAKVTPQEDLSGESGFAVKFCADTGMTYPEMYPTFEPIGLGGTLTVSAIDAFARQFEERAALEGSYLTPIPFWVKACTTLQNETEAQGEKSCSCTNSHYGTTGFDGHHTSTYGLHTLMNYDDVLSLGKKWGACIYYASHPVCVGENVSQTACVQARDSAKREINDGLVRGTCVVRKRPFSKMKEAITTTTHELGHVFGASHHTDQTICVMNESMKNRPDVANENAFCTTCAAVIRSYLNSCRLFYHTAYRGDMALHPVIRPDGTIVYVSDEIACDVDSSLTIGKRYEEVGQKYESETLVSQETICDPVEDEHYFDDRESMAAAGLFSAKDKIYEWAQWRDTEKQSFLQSETSGAWEYQLKDGGVVTLLWYDFGKEYAKRMEESCKKAVENGSVLIEQGPEYPVYCQKLEAAPEEWNYWSYQWARDGIWFIMQSVGTDRLPVEACRLTTGVSNTVTE